VLIHLACLNLPGGLDAWRTGGLDSLEVWISDLLISDTLCADGLTWSDLFISLIYLKTLIPDTPDTASEFRQIVKSLMYT
jgi:hypothetical protein